MQRSKSNIVDTMRDVASDHKLNSSLIDRTEFSLVILIFSHKLLNERWVYYPIDIKTVRKRYLLQMESGGSR